MCMLNSSLLFYAVDKLHTLYCDFLKRLDDNSDEVRIAITEVLSAYVG